MARRTYFQTEFEAQLRDRLDDVSAEEKRAKKNSVANGFHAHSSALPVVSLTDPIPSHRPFREDPSDSATQTVSTSDNGYSSELNGRRDSFNGTTSPSKNSVDITETQNHVVETSAGAIRVDGNALMCACPDCRAPMTIRLWLGLADCWKCDTSIQLSQEQLEAARQLAPQPEPIPLTPPAPAPAIFDEALVEPELDEETAIVVAPPSDSRHAELDRLTQSSLAAQILRRGFNAVPAWLVSFLIHLILVLLLALIMLGQQETPPMIILSSFFDKQRSAGGEIRIENPLDTLVDEVMAANDMDLDETEVRHVLQKAEQDAKQLVVDKAPIAQLPDLDDVKKNITTRTGPIHSFAARDPRVRAEIVRREGGTTLTEAAVSRGLRWLASVQNKDGSWSLANYDRHFRENNEGDSAATALALLPFLGAGQTHEYGRYKLSVARGLRWLMQNQKRNGDLRADFPGEAGMYAHGQATIVLCEALAMTGDQQFHDPAQRAIQFIEKAQHIRGGWRYKPGQAGDTSILGWQLMALQSARSPNLGLEINEDTLRLADLYLDDAAHRGGGEENLPRGALYKYLPNEGRPTPTMTAEALLCRMYLGWQRDDPRMRAGVKWLVQEHLPSYKKKNIYFWYYGTQVMHHYGGKPWEKWNNKVREILVATQEKRASRAGSWNPSGYQWGSQGGRIYVTSLAVCTLEVYYRHLPLFKQLNLDAID